MSGPRITVTDALIRLYPPRWRERYGAEFAQLLEDERADGRPGVAWWLDVVVHALRARARTVGSAGSTALFLIPAMTV